MKTYSGKPVNLHASPEQIYQFLSDFSHFQAFLPEQITEWESGDGYCSFALQNVGKIKLVFTYRNPYSEIVVQPEAQSDFPVTFSLKALISEKEFNSIETPFQFIAEIGVNAFIAPIIDKPMKQFVEIITEKIEQHFSV